MRAFKITILGCGAAIPTAERNPTAQLVEVGNLSLIFDCGEGTQMQLRHYSRHPQRISHIFISHLHGDHFYGLIGLLNSLHLLGRQKELHLFGPLPLKEIIDLQLYHSGTTLSYPLLFHPVNTEEHQLIFEDRKVTVHTIPMVHRIPTCGFLVKEKPAKRKIRKDFVSNYTVATEEYESIRDGGNFTDHNGVVHLNHLITDDPPPAKSYAYCSDTLYNEAIIPIIAGCDILYHEATFLHDRQADAAAKYHSTALQAATLANKAGVKNLLIGHYSARYKDATVLLNEARSVFPNSFLAEDGMVIEL